MRGRLGSMLRAHLEVVVPLDVIEQSEVCEGKGG